jgi:F-type H+-transporting ATPase subunit alpha
MDIKTTDLVSLFEKSLSEIPEPELQEIGIIIQVGDGFCYVHGLKHALYGELVEFDSGSQGIVMDLQQEYVTVFLLNADAEIKEREIVKRTGNVFKVPVSMNMAGRVVNILGHPIDALGDIESTEKRPIEVEIPGIIERKPIDEPLETGITVIDTLVPIGRGQRELIIGNRGTGKTSIALDTILHQKGKGVYCIYVAIGQKKADIARTVRLLQEHGALEYTVIVSSDAGQPAIDRYLAPYAGCTIGEYFRELGHDALIVYDDLTNHAIAYREMSLLMRRAPGREAYPGDVFYLHARLLERAGRLAKGGALTALPIVQIQANDITAYIPTNLISITDGQIFLDSKLFNEGVRPAVNIELSVSRVGGSAQTKAIKRVTKALRLELAQYNDLLDFAQFGTELDVISQKRLARGARAIELLKQKAHVTYSFVDQALMLFLLKENFLDDIEVKHIQDFTRKFVSYTKSVYKDLYKNILSTKDVSSCDFKDLSKIAQEFSSAYTPDF